MTLLTPVSTHILFINSTFLTLYFLLAAYKPETGGYHDFSGKDISIILATGGKIDNTTINTWGKYVVDETQQATIDDWYKHTYLVKYRIVSKICESRS